MIEKKLTGFEEYRDLRLSIDDLIEKIEKKHKKHITCKSGCDLCCMDYSIFPVEFYSIAEELKGKKFKKKTEPENLPFDESCIFLEDHKCTIYRSRPIICRTHGLPLLFANEEGEWELSACELNFTMFDFEKFSTKNTFPQDKYNSKLFLLNKKFLSELKKYKYNEFDLIPLKNLINHL